MKTYQIEMLNNGSIKLFRQLEIEDKKSWQNIGIFSREKAAIYLLLCATDDIDLAFKYGERFENHELSLKESFPRLINTTSIRLWLGDQVLAAV